MLKKFAFVGAVALSIGSASAATVTIGTGNSPFAEPFAPGAFSLNSDSERYQQIWDASNFADLGRIEIQSISFVPTALGSRAPEASRSSYDLSFSTTSRTIAELTGTQEDPDYDSNLGQNNALFGSIRFERGVLAVEPTVSGSFVYDPSAGNLLLDMDITLFQPNAGTGFFVEGSDQTSGAYATSFSGSQFSTFGAVATFEYEPVGDELEVSVVPLPASFGFLAFALAGFGIGARRRRVAG